MKLQITGQKLNVSPWTISTIKEIMFPPEKIWFDTIFKGEVDGDKIAINDDIIYHEAPSIYDWMMSLEHGEILEYEYCGDVFRFMMFEAWPVQIAGPKMDGLHRLKNPAETLPKQHLCLYETA
jgi:hypothetical protein